VPGYTVNLYVVARISIDVEADNQTDAIAVATENSAPQKYPLEYADEILSATVDEEGDHEYKNSKHYVATPGGWLADAIGTTYVVTCDNCQTEIVVGHAHWSSLVCTNEVCKCEIPNPKGEC
jgi:hypothetical protein